MPNNFDSALVADSIAAQTKTVLSKRLAPLSLFASDYSSDVKKPGDTIKVPIASAGSTTQINPTSFNSIGGSTVGKASVTLSHIYQPFGLSYEDMKNGHRLDRLTQVNADALADKIWELATAQVTVANFPNASVITTAEGDINPTSGDLAELRAGVHKSQRKGLLVSPVIYSNLIPTNSLGLSLNAGAYGFENGVFEVTSFSGETDLVGFACSPDALVMASAMPALNSDSYEVQSIVLEQLGLTIMMTMHHDTSVRADIATFEVMFGAAKGLTDGTMALIVPA